MEQLLSYAVITFLGLFPITNPIGVVPTFYSLTVGQTPQFRGRQARQVATNVVVVLTIFLIVGQLILDLFGLSLGAMQIAGGVLIAHTAWNMVTASPIRATLNNASETEKDITFIPMAVPIISGPGAIGMVMGLIAQDPQPANYVGSLLGILGIGGLVYFSLRFGAPLIKTLGRSGIHAVSKILGFFILALAIQLMANGAVTVFHAAIAD